MSIQRVNTVLLHTWYHFIHSMESWADLFWVPILQLLVFVFIAGSLGNGSTQQGLSMIIGMIFWNIIGVGEYAIAVGALWEIWSKSLSSLFITPLSMQEFVIGQMISGFFKALFVFILASVVGFFLYKFSVLSLGWMLPIYFILLLLFSWGMGMFVLSLIFRFGTEIQALSWALIYFIQPIGGVFYPVDVLPAGIRWASFLFPTTYAFESIRLQLFTGQIHWVYIFLAFAIDGIYLLVGYLALYISFTKSKENGRFARLEG